MLENTWYYRVVAASPVSPVSTKPLFPSLVVCLVSTISIAQQTPTQGPQARRWHVETSSKRCEGCGLQDKQTIGKLKPVLYDAMGRKPRYSYMWNCHLTYEKWPKNGLRSNSIASQFQIKFLEKHSPGPPLPVARILYTHYEPDSSNLMATALYYYWQSNGLPLLA